MRRWIATLRTRWCGSWTMRFRCLTRARRITRRKSAKLQAEKQAYQLAECQKRAERFPTDLQIRFELGQLYFQSGEDRRGHPGVSEGPGQPPPAHCRDELPGAMLCQAKDVRPRHAHPARRPEGEAGLRRGEEGVDLQPRLRAREHGEEGRGDQAVRADLRGGHRLPGCGGEEWMRFTPAGKRRRWPVRQSEVRGPQQLRNGLPVPAQEESGEGLPAPPLSP